MKPMRQLVSFGRKHGSLNDPDVLVFSAAQVPNPHKIPKLRDRDGRDAEVQRMVLRSPKGAALASRVACAIMTAPGDITVAVRCHGGRHRSVAIVEEAARIVRALGFDVDVVHRDLR